MQHDFYCEQVLSGRTKVEVVAETERSLAFKHTNAAYPVHIVVIPRRHIPSLTAATDEEMEDVYDVLRLVRDVARAVEHEHGKCKIITNLGAYQDSKHLHWHVLVQADSIG